ncbi:SpvB/TcaC N-terminal domain-containing protein [Nocardioides ungokensis]
MGEKFEANPVTGTGSMSIPVAVSPGRSGFGPSLALSYDSGAGNGAFGFGWSLALPAITRRTDAGLPRYLDAEESDVFVLSGAEDLVPCLVQDGGGAWRRETSTRTVGGHIYRVDPYRPRIEGLFARIERWTDTDDGAEVFWRSISRDNVTTLYGRTAESRVADPADPTRIFSWLTCETHDDKGNVVSYGYKSEDSDGIFEDALGSPVSKAHERHRTAGSRSAQRYLKRIRYANGSPYFPVLDPAIPWPEPPSIDASAGGDWLFEVVLDYGEHGTDAPTPTEDRTWSARRDPFSSYRAGFEIRTYRICRRVLMFHHFPDEPQVGTDCLTRSTDLTYSDEQQPADERNPIYTFLRAVTQTGYRRDGAGYDARSLPPVEFEYTDPMVSDDVGQLDPTSLDQLPVGLDGSTYRWTDLHGDGVAGVLSEHDGAWFYQRNLSPVAEDGRAGRARLARAETVATKPSLSFATGAELLDLAGDGRPDVVTWQRPTPGFFAHDDDEGWLPFRAFAAPLTRDMHDPNLRFVDLDGDGRAELLITDDDALVWHPSRGEAGFGPEQRVGHRLDEQQSPRVVFADASQSTYLADLSGDGLPDIARIRNGEVCYWPNLGRGRFGAKVTMDDAPWFDNPDLFDPRRVLLADIDGSGTVDLIYLHRDGVRLYFNQSGNGWSAPHQLKVFPHADDLVRVIPVDLLGNGTTCLVWSSPLAEDTRRPLRYVDLMGGRKPHLLVRSSNNLGAETRVEYAPSTKFFVRDRLDGRPWVTRLPFPVHVVERVQTYDQVSQNRFVARYAYHDGYYDGDEREFRGFGMVEQWDTEEMAALSAGALPGANIALDSVVPPVHTKTWFHTGAFRARDEIADRYAGSLDGTESGEYFREPGLTASEAHDLLLADTVLPSGLSLEEEREACRALKGTVLRRELYADDAGPGSGDDDVRRAHTPYTVTEQNMAVRVVQPRAGNRHAVFLPHAREALTFHYERNPADPRLQHSLTLEVDEWGNTLQQATVGYGRRPQVRVIDGEGHVRVTPNPGLAGLDPADRAKQTATVVTYSQNRTTNAVVEPDGRRSPLPAEAVTFELTGFAPTSASGRFLASDLVELDPTDPRRVRLRFTDEVGYEQAPTAGRCRRPIEHDRTLYRRNDLSGLLALGQLESQALGGEAYQLALTAGLLALLQRPRVGQPAETLVPDASVVLGGQGGDRGGYVAGQTLIADGRFPEAQDPADTWWVPSGTSYFTTDTAAAPAAELAQARHDFYCVRRFRDPFGHDAVVDFDEHRLLVAGTQDALGNRTTVDANDYRVLEPRLVSDPNGNQNEVAFDTLGLVAGTAVMGKPAPAPAEGDSLVGFDADLTPVEVDGFFGDGDPRVAGRGLLHDASTRIVYDLDRFRRTKEDHPDDPSRWQPVCAATIARETHVSDLPPEDDARIQVSFSYSDGLGREIQKKVQAEPGPVDPGEPLAPVISPRWVGSGWTVFNNKGKPVRQYEPFFSATHDFELGITVGVSPVLFYDPVERVVATLHPNDVYEKVVFDAWRQSTYDANDTCAPHGSQTGDPRTDPDVGGYVDAYFVTRPGWQTWYHQRVGGALGGAEQDAAQRAAAHSDTPAVAHLDSLGRPFLTVAHNRLVCPGHDLDGTEDAVVTRTDLDIEGNQRAVRDERRPAVGGIPTGTVEQRVVVLYDYDMLGHRIRQLSIEAGPRWMLQDVVGNSIRSWDGRGHDVRVVYDELRRRIEQYVRGTFADPDPAHPSSDPRTIGAELLVDRIEYGEPAPGATDAERSRAQQLNLRTRTYRRSDSAGVTTSARLDGNGDPQAAYDFKGNLLHSTRRFVTDYAAIPDWSQAPVLDGETFESSTRYDAFNRTIQSVEPHSSLARAKRNVIQPLFNEANLLERVDVWLERADEPDALLDPTTEPSSPVGVDDIEYDAHGRRVRIQYKNGTSTSYAYDPLTFRLTALVTNRSAATFPGDDPQPPVARWPGSRLQSLSYTYDAAGNITHVADDAQQAIFFANKRVEPSNDYVYDALYRLVQATGREHLGQNGALLVHTYVDDGRVGLVSADGGGGFAPGDGNAMGTYVERYVYDAVGNILQMQHRRSDTAPGGWTRSYSYTEASLIEGGRVGNRLTSTQVGGAAVELYLHDVHGNMTRLPHLGGGQPGPNLHWDYDDRAVQADLGGGGTAHTVYDASGQRVRKIWEKAPGLVEERIYLGGVELHRRHPGPIGAGTATLERETLHVTDDQQSVALVETRTLDTGGNDPAPRQLIRYQAGNHLGSVGLELDEGARIISYEEYSPYGSSTYQAVRSQTETPKRYRYTGKERDEETGLCYYGARYYAPWLARWTSCDPVPQLNLYVFCDLNPVTLSDPTGREPVKPVSGPYRTVRGDHVHQVASRNAGPGASRTSASEFWGGRSVSTNSPGYNDAGGQRVESALNRAQWGSDMNGAPAKTGRVTINASGETTVGSSSSASPSQWFEDVKSYYKLREAGLSPDDALNEVFSSADQLEKAGATPTRVPNGPRSAPRALKAGQTLSSEQPTRLSGSAKGTSPEAVSPAQPEAVPAPAEVEAPAGSLKAPTGAPASTARTLLRAGGTGLAVAGTVYSAYAFGEDVSEGRWGSAALNGTAFAGGGLALGGTAVGSTTLVGAGTVIAAPAAVVGAGVAGWKLGEYTNENTAISDVAMAGGSLVERVTGSSTLGAVGAAGTAIVTAPVFVPIAVGKGIGRGAKWVWNKIF